MYSRPGRLNYGLIYYKPLTEEEYLISTHNTFEDFYLCIHERVKGNELMKTNEYAGQTNDARFPET